ncbi:MAG TPA: hypothetical protein G4N92_06110 [Anaerolineae bacterium]|nr:hypothetical protein [Anaerolineae bacterium]
MAHNKAEMRFEKRTNIRWQGLFVFAILLGSFIFVITGCEAKLFFDKTPTSLSIEEQVLQTLVAFQIQYTLNPNYPQQAEPFGESYSMEVTQVVELDANHTGASPKMDDFTELPEQHYIWEIWGHRQFFPIGCEAAVVKDWAAYFGVEINEFNFQYQLPQSDNPDLGFVGSVEGPWGQVPPYAYGVHASPVAQVLREQYGMNAVGIKQFTLEQLKAQIAADRPVIAWVIGNCVGGSPYEYTDKEGNVTTVAAYEHVVIVTGYSMNIIRYMSNGKFYDIPANYFLNSWGVLGNLVVYLDL